MLPLLTQAIEQTLQMFRSRERIDDRRAQIAAPVEACLHEIKIARLDDGPAELQLKLVDLCGRPTA